MQNTSSAFEISRVSKLFRLYQEKNATLKERLLYRGRTSYSEFWALRDVSVTIPQGQTVSLIGRNGSGKSTLLKIMSGIMVPTRGAVEMQGRVSSLLELGAGFHPEFTGRENIYMNASILGFSKKDVEQRMEEIISFSELGSFIDNPIRGYSSGMYMRLAFSVAIMVDPDVLLLDEILAVGDVPFQRKCLNRIRTLAEEGKTIVLVTHDIGAAERLSDQIIWLESGGVVDFGKPQKVLPGYMKYVNDERNTYVVREDTNKVQEVDEGLTKKDEGADDISCSELPQQDRYGSGEVMIEGVLLRDANGEPTNVVYTGDSGSVQIKYKTMLPCRQLHFAIKFLDSKGNNCYNVSTVSDGLETVEADGRTITFEFEELPFLTGHYYMDVQAQDVEGKSYDTILRVTDFEVITLRQESGLCRVKHRWAI